MGCSDTQTAPCHVPSGPSQRAVRSKNGSFVMRPICGAVTYGPGVPAL